MKKYIFSLVVLISLAFSDTVDCGDGNIYSVKKQTKNDRRFDKYTKIKKGPKLKKGKLDDIIDEKLKVFGVGKTQIFNLNYQFTVTCKGKIVDVKSLGAKHMADWTNIVDIIKSTEGLWKPAKKDGEFVDCVFFNKKFVWGSDY